MAYRLLAWAGIARVKSCTRCGVVLPLHRFPLKKGKPYCQCRPCKNESQRISRKRKMQDPEYREAERARMREKWHRITKNGEYEKANRSRIVAEYRERYPEKAAAQEAANSKLPPSKMRKHHWSYMECHQLSVIYLTHADHVLLHRHLKYDREHRLYRDKKTGELLDNPEAHIKVLARAKKK